MVILGGLWWFAVVCDGLWYFNGAPARGGGGGGRDGG